MNPTEPTPESLAVFWGKLGRGKNSAEGFHPLICHMLDVAAVARALWRDVLPPAARVGLARAFALGEDAAERWVAFLAGSHDLGKCSPAFTLQNDARHLRGLYPGLADPPAGLRAPHGTITARTLPAILRDRFHLDPDTARQLSTVVGGHHGTFPSRDEMSVLHVDAVGRLPWQPARNALIAMVGELEEIPGQGIPDRLDNAHAMLLAGLVSVADWIGSNVDFFPYAVQNFRAPRTFDFGAYHARSAAQAVTALRALGWTGWQPPRAARSFAALFPEIPTPRPLQDRTIALADAFQGPTIIVIEAPMGEGKTEAALYFVDRLGVASGETGGTRGAYVALPTQATSNQMFSRIRAFLAGRYAGEQVQLQLLHGHAALDAEFQAMVEQRDERFRPDAIHAIANEALDLASVVAGEWFTYRKRGLLAPFGVGTVDQALLAVLQVRHVFVRLFGLAHKTVIVDEVHAYDAYMATLLERLLEWLGALGSPVALLSATLPCAQRQALLAAYARGAGWPVPAATNTPYPRVSWAAGDESGADTVAVSALNTRRLALEWLDGRLPVAQERASDRSPSTALITQMASATAQPEPGLFPLVRLLRDNLKGGGCAAVICNTVARAQAVYTALKPYFPGTTDDGEPELDLFHARFLYRDRAERERRALRRFGKPSDPTVRRPYRAVLVATQVIEQSLDLDFDLMVSDFAPADLLLQRAGRLHRHQRSQRPVAALPTLHVCQPERVEDGVPRFDGGSEAVYDGHVLLRSWLALHDRGVIAVPEDVEALIEAVYADSATCDASASAAVRAQWEATRRTLASERDEARKKADQALIRPPQYRGDILDGFNRELEEDNPDVHRTLQAATRLADPSVTVVVLKQGERAQLEPAGTPTLDAARNLLARSVPITGRGIVPALLAIDPPAAWQRSPLLRHCRLVELGETHRNRVQDYLISLDRELGVTVTSAKQTAEQPAGPA